VGDRGGWLWPMRDATLVRKWYIKEATPLPSEVQISYHADQNSVAAIANEIRRVYLLGCNADSELILRGYLIDRRFGVRRPANPGNVVAT
jgi:hypothetical protein